MEDAIENGIVNGIINDFQDIFVGYLSHIDVKNRWGLINKTFFDTSQIVNKSKINDLCVGDRIAYTCWKNKTTKQSSTKIIQKIYINLY